MELFCRDVELGLSLQGKTTDEGNGDETMRGIIGPRREKVTEEWSGVHNGVSLSVLLT
jgi:hypothetical protein